MRNEIFDPSRVSPYKVPFNFTRLLKLSKLIATSAASNNDRKNM